MSLQDLAIQNSPQMNGLSQLINTIKSAQDPTTLINSTLSSNPMVKQAQQVAQQYGGVEAAVRAIAQQRGIDLQALFKQLQG